MNKTPVEEFADKYDICAFGRELLIERKQVKTLAEAWEAGDTLCTIFMYVKGVREADWLVFYYFANFIKRKLFDDGYKAHAKRLDAIMDEYLEKQNALISLQITINDLLIAGKRKESAELHTPQMSISIARNVALFALDYAAQARYGKFNLKFSFEMANVFRIIVGKNPFASR